MFDQMRTIVSRSLSNQHPRRTQGKVEQPLCWMVFTSANTGPVGSLTLFNMMRSSYGAASANTKPGCRNVRLCWPSCWCELCRSGGGFHAHTDNPKDGTAEELSYIPDNFGLSQHVTDPTHNKRHILGLIISKGDTARCLTSSLIIIVFSKMAELKQR